MTSEQPGIHERHAKEATKLADSLIRELTNEPEAWTLREIADWAERNAPNGWLDWIGYAQHAGVNPPSALTKRLVLETLRARAGGLKS